MTKLERRARLLWLDVHIAILWIALYVMGWWRGLDRHAVEAEVARRFRLRELTREHDV